MRAKCRVGLIGYSVRQKDHLAAFRAVRRCEVVAAADWHQDKRQAFSRDYGVNATYASAAEMIERCDLDVVNVVTRHRRMRKPVLEAIAAGARGILLEKPFGVDLEDARAMMASAEAAGAVLLVNYQSRYMELAERMRGLLASGELGAVEYFRAVGGKNLHGQGVHVIDLVRFVYGERPVSWALGNFAGLESADATQIGPTCDVGVIAFEDGVPMYVESGLEPTAAPYRGEELKMYVDAVCTRGRVWLGLAQGMRIWHRDGRYEEVPASWPEICEPAQPRLVRSLIDALENGTGSRCDARRAYVTQEAICALLESGLTHRKIPFPVEIAPGLIDRVMTAVTGSPPPEGRRPG